VKDLSILVIGGGIGGLTAAIALRQRGFSVTLVEKEPVWSAYGVGIIQQGNVLRAVAALGILDRYIDAGVGFDAVEVYAPDGRRLARVPSPRLLEGRPANLGIARPALQQVLVDTAKSAGTSIRLGVTVSELHEDQGAVRVRLSDGSDASFDLVIGADGLHSSTRERVLPAAERPQFTGQAVWRYNLPRPEGLDALHVYNGATGVGLVPMSASQMYMYVTTAEPGNPRHPREGLAAQMRDRVAHHAPAIRTLAEQITDDDGVVYRPLESGLVTGPWHSGRVVLLGDAVHATTPHLGQGAGLAIEDSLVLAEELARAKDPDAALHQYRARRYERCAYIVRASLAICLGQLGKGPPVDNAKATAEMFALTAQPI
jgi:2-polyprenyl-6-methoxyphenol hydroxylase-like FAD-dependent oxidoreductase